MSELIGFAPEGISCRSSSPLERLTNIDEVRKTQVQMLNSLFEHAEKSLFYKERIQDRRLYSLDGLRQIPLLTREDITKFGALNSHEMETGERENGWIFRSSGSSGKPFFSIRTREDVEVHLSRAGRFMENVLGVNDVIFNCNFMGGGWSGGISAHDFLSRTRAMSVPLGSHLKPEEYIEFWREIRPNAIIAMPSFLKKLAGMFDGVEGLSRIEKVFFVGEPFWPDEREFFREKLGLQNTSFFGHYANTECGAVGMQICNQTANDVYHVIPDGNIIEIVDPESLEAVEPGKPGRIVITSFNRLHKPIIRLLTDDLGCLLLECGCGLHTQMLEVFGKSTGELVKIGRMQVSMRKFITEIIHFLAGEGISIPTKQLQLSRNGGNLIIDMFLETLSPLQTVLPEAQLKEILSHSSAEMGVIPLEDLEDISIRVQVVPVGSIEGVGTAGKIPLIVDNRK